MTFSIVTASLNQLPWLKRCVRSVADQCVECEQIVQDAGTGSALEKWVGMQPQTRLFVERDAGIYDALNRGFARATGEVCAWLNCDEQYLPGTLAKVAAAFQREPGADLVVGDFLILNERGELLAFRRATPLRPAMILTDHLYDFTCAMFFRRQLFDRAGSFRTDFRAVGDAEWVCRAVRASRRIVYLREYLATFAISGENLSLRASAEDEQRKLRAITPAWARVAAPLLRKARHVEKWLAGGYSSGPICYEIFANEKDERRTRFLCERPEWRHPWA